MIGTSFFAKIIPKRETLDRVFEKPKKQLTQRNGFFTSCFFQPKKAHLTSTTIRNFTIIQIVI